MGARAFRGVATALALSIWASATVPVASANPAHTTSAAPVPYATQAPVVMLKDLESGAILFSRGADKRFAPASMAKVMTAYVVLDLLGKGKLTRDTKFTVGPAAWKKWNSSTGGSSMFLSPNERVSVDDLLKGLITVSGNDAAAVLAIGIDGSEEAFVKRMNAVATDIGMMSSRFGTPNGWPDGGITRVSASDLVTLAERLIRDHPEGYARYFAIPELKHGLSPDGRPIVQANRNPILGRFDGADGLKTGYTREAGYCFLGSAERGGRRLIMVVAGLTSQKARAEEAQKLMDWGFATRAVTAAGQQASRKSPATGAMRR